MFKLYINKQYHKSYKTLRGVRIAAGIISSKFDRGELIAVPGEVFLSWSRIDKGVL